MANNHAFLPPPQAILLCIVVAAAAQQQITAPIGASFGNGFNGGFNGGQGGAGFGAGAGGAQGGAAGAAGAGAAGGAAAGPGFIDYGPKVYGVGAKNRFALPPNPFVIQRALAVANSVPNVLVVSASGWVHTLLAVSGLLVTCSSGS